MFTLASGPQLGYSLAGLHSLWTLGCCLLGALLALGLLLPLKRRVARWVWPLAYAGSWVAGAAYFYKYPGIGEGLCNDSLLEVAVFVTVVLLASRSPRIGLLPAAPVHAQALLSGRSPGEG